MDFAQIFEVLKNWVGPGAAIAGALGYVWWDGRGKRRLEDAQVNSSYAAAGSWEPLFARYQQMLDSLHGTLKATNERADKLAEELREAQVLVLKLQAQVESQQELIETLQSMLKGGKP